MTKQKKLILIPLTLVAALLIYCWTIILTTEISATWKQYLGLILFLLIAFLFFKSIIITTLATGVYLLLATFNLLAITAEIYTIGFRVGSISTPDIQLLSLGLFIIYFILNLDSLINIHLDYQEAKQKKAQTKIN